MTQQNETQIITLTGMGGVGKTTVAEKLLEFRHLFAPLQGVMTRPLRPSDRPWENRVISPDEFEALAWSKSFVCSAIVGEYKYGVLASEVERALADTQKMYIRVLALDSLEAFRRFVLDKKTPWSVRSFYLRVRDPQTLFERMSRRDSLDIAAKRLQLEVDLHTQALGLEVSYRENYDEPLFHKTVFNDGDIEQAVLQVLQGLSRDV